MVTKEGNSGTVQNGRCCFLAFQSILAVISHYFKKSITQSAITCSKLTIETLELSVKYVQS